MAAELPEGWVYTVERSGARRIVTMIASLVLFSAAVFVYQAWDTDQDYDAAQAACDRGGHAVDCINAANLLATTDTWMGYAIVAGTLAIVLYTAAGMMPQWRLTIAAAPGPPEEPYDEWRDKTVPPSFTA